MKEKKNISSSKLKQVVLLFFFLLLLAPMIQQKFKFVKEKNLIDVDNHIDIPTFSFSYWLDGTFQTKFEESLDVNIGFRKTLVRLQNQIYYSVFNITKAGSNVIGENQYLYGKSYLWSYIGADFLGKEAIDLQVEKIQVVQQEFKNRNISLLIAFAPGKGSYFPENISNDYLKNYTEDSTNYTYYFSACKKADINIVDLRSYFLKMKDTIKYPLFSQVGVHWGDYAAVLAIDTIAKKIEQLKKIKLKCFKISSFEYRDSIKAADKDAENMMNLFCSLPAYKMTYIKVDYPKCLNYIKPHLLSVSDSYFSTIVATGIPDSIFSSCDYWIYNDYRFENRARKGYDFKKDIESRDVILLLATDATLAQFPYNFINEAYEVYAPKNQHYYNLKNKEFRLFYYTFIKNVEKSKKWKRSLIKNAKARKISLLEEYINNAAWLYNEQEIKNRIFVKNKK